MDDLISRQAAIDAIVNTVSEIGLHDNSEVARYGATFRQHEIIDIIEGLPSAQSEVIYCKDCKWWDQIPSGTIVPEYHDCRKSFRIGATTMPYDYCSRAERREE